jgi:hypothetical protein
MKSENQRLVTTISVPYSDYLIHEIVGYDYLMRGMYLETDEAKDLLDTAMAAQRKHDAELIRKVLAASDNAEVRVHLAALAEQLEQNEMPMVSVSNDDDGKDSLIDFVPL